MIPDSLTTVSIVNNSAHEVRYVPAEPVVDNPLTPYYFILHDNPVREVVLASGQALPEVQPLRNSTGMKLTESVQWTLFNLCLMACFGDTDWKRHLDTYTRRKQFTRNFIALYDGGRAFCNGEGLDTCRCWVEEVIMRVPRRNDKIARQIPIVCGGNVVKRINTAPTVDGFIQIEVWDGVSQPGRHHILHHATSITPEGSVNRFPQFSDFGAVFVPYVVPSSAPQYIAVGKVRQLRQSELFPSPYRGRL